MNDLSSIDKRMKALYDKVSRLIKQARAHVASAVSSTEIYTKYTIGEYIIEDEQCGNYRARNGKKSLSNLSDRLTHKFGKGWSIETLEKCRNFYKVYSKPATPSWESQLDNSLINENTTSNPISTAALRKSNIASSFSLSWSLYLSDKTLLQSKVKE